MTDKIDPDRLLAEYIRNWPIPGEEQIAPPRPPDDGYPQAMGAYHGWEERNRSYGHLTDHDRILSLEFRLQYLREQLTKTLDKPFY